MTHEAYIKTIPVWFIANAISFSIKTILRALHSRINSCDLRSLRYVLIESEYAKQWISRA
jgi:hypothetical protein